MRKDKHFRVGALLLALAGGLPQASPPAESVDAAIRADPIMRSMLSELRRTVEAAEAFETASPLYYLGYEIRDGVRYSIGGLLGAVEHDVERRLRTLDVDARFGSRELDNTHQLKGRSGRFEYPRRRRIDIPVDDDEVALRAALWRATDLAMNASLTRLTKVQTNKAVTADEEDSSHDFSQEQPSVYYDPVPLPELDRESWRRRVAELSAKIKQYPFVYSSSVRLSVQGETQYLVNSEGTRIAHGNRFVRLSYRMTTRTEDGMDLERGASYDGDEIADMPDDEQVLADLHASAAELKALLEAPIVEPYSGPAIIRNRATAVFFHEILGHRLEGHRQKLEKEGQTFTKMLHKPVVADFISVYDDPTLRHFGDQFLRGFYVYDNEGVPAQRTTLVRDGALEGFLMGRSPIANFPQSNGHGRRSAGHFTVARMGNTLVEASQTVPYDELYQMLLAELKRQNKPYGFVFYDISGGFTTTQRTGPQSFKVLPHLVRRVYADGRPDEVVRGVDIVGTPLSSFNKILAAADDYGVFNGTCGAESGQVPVSGVAPSVLVSEIEIEKRMTQSEKPPLLVPPHAEGREP